MGSKAQQAATQPAAVSARIDEQAATDATGVIDDFR